MNRRRAFAGVALGVFLRLSASAFAQTSLLGAGAPAIAPPGAGSDSIPTLPALTHAWVVVPEPAKNGEGPRAAVLHLVPRAPGPTRATGSTQPADGMARPARSLPFLPTHIGAWGERLFLVKQGARGYDKRDKSVVALRAVRSGVAEFWTTEPRDHMDVLPGLPARCVLLDFCGSAVGPVAAAWFPSESSPRDGRVRLLACGDREWRELSLPADVSAQIALLAGGRAAPAPPPGEAPPTLARALRLVPGPDSVSLVLGGTSQLREWRVRCDPSLLDELRPRTRARVQTGGKVLPSRAAPAEGPLTPAWTAVVVTPLPIAGAGPEWHLLNVSRQRVLVQREQDGRIAIYAAVPEGRWRELDHVAEVPAGFCVAPLDGVGRVALVWDAGHAGTPRQQIREISVWTGRELHAGSLGLIAPVGIGELRILALVLFGVMSLVLLFVLRADARDVGLVLPEGTALAEPGRRFAATLADLLVAMLLCSRLFGVTVLEVVSPAAMISGTAWPALGASLALAALVCTVSESLTGRSLGKWLTGCEVVHERAGRDGAPLRPSLTASLVRNLLKWGLPPLAILAFSDPASRHAGDRLAKAVVVVRIHEREPDDSDED